MDAISTPIVLLFSHILLTTNKKTNKQTKTDARTLVDHARVEALNHRFTFDEVRVNERIGE